MTTQILLQVNNLIFILPFALGLLYLGLYTTTGLVFGELDSDGGTDHDLSAHLDLDHDVDAHLDVDQDLGADHNLDTDTHETQAASSDHSGGSAFLSALTWVGIGRMPLSLVLLVMMLCWGMIGFCANQLQLNKPQDVSLPISLASALIGSLLITHFISAIAGRTLFATQHIARRRHELLGALGEALYPIDATFGMVTGRDDRGTLFQVACRIEQGQQPIAKGTAVQLVGYTAKDRMFFVAPADSAKTRRRQPQGT